MRLINIFFITIFLISSGCSKYIDTVKPTDKLDTKDVYNGDKTAIAAVTSIMGRMRDVNINILTSLSSDELKNYALTDPSLARFYNNKLLSKDFPIWGNLYGYIYTCNDAITELEKSTGVSENIRQQLIGEARFLRAFYYFYLVNLFGDVPLITSTDYTNNSVATRTPGNLVYEQIVKDLVAAKSLLSKEYLDGTLKNITDQRLRPTKAAANALLARTYLFMADYANAEIAASYVIDSSSNIILDGLENVFLVGSQEAIWQLESYEGVLSNTSEAKFFVLRGAPTPDRPVTVSDSLYNAFEVNDERRINWIGTIDDGGNQYHFVYKYKVADYGLPVTEHTLVLRLAEQYLIRAEARAFLGKLTGAGSDLNAIRSRAGLDENDADTKDEILKSVIQERQKELFTEWGDRWLTLKRLNIIDSVMTTAAINKNTTWNIDWALYPIPQREIETGVGLRGHQNLGY